MDNQGNLIINTPLYVIEKTGEKLNLKRAPSSMNREVYVGIPCGDSSYQMEFTGGIVKGRLSIIIKKPEEYWLYEVANDWNISDDIFTNGAEIKIGELMLGGIEPEYRPIYLFPNQDVQVFIEQDPFITAYNIKGARYEHIYSLGDVNFIGKFYTSRWGYFKYHKNFDIQLKNGWNVIRTNDYYDNIHKYDVFNKISSLPSKNAVWVLLE